MESKIIYQVEKADLINLFNEIIEQREQAKNSQVYYSLKEVLKITGKNRSTLWNWERKGYLKPVLWGKLYFQIFVILMQLGTQKEVAMSKTTTTPDKAPIPQQLTLFDNESMGEMGVIKQPIK